MAHQSLYRRYRPVRFADLRGQDHVVTALRNAVAQGSEGHAYLFSGPRGTGKTSTARILAKALNCTNLVDGEPCGECESCVAIQHGNSYDLFELDAASNNGVDAMRDLIGRTAIGSPGRTKVYILDEVHMLTPAASNALLKTLEEPPDHVKFVLATTDPQKVLPTIRSRTQHFEFSLLSASDLTEFVEWIRTDAELDIDDDAVAHVVRQGRGSARDTLSALDMVVAAGGVNRQTDSIEAILAALGDRSTANVMAAISDAVAQGREPRVLAEQLLGSLRDAFLVSVQAPLDHLSDSDQAVMGELARSLGPATITRALETVGSAVVEMRQAADPRVPLEVALIRLTTPSTDRSLDALLERIEELERRLASGIPAATSGPRSAPADSPASVPTVPAPTVPAPTVPDFTKPEPVRPRPRLVDANHVAEGDTAGHPHPSEHEDRADGEDPASAGNESRPAGSGPASIREQLARSRGGATPKTSTPPNAPRSAETPGATRTHLAAVPDVPTSGSPKSAPAPAPAPAPAATAPPAAPSEPEPEPTPAVPETAAASTSTPSQSTPSQPNPSQSRSNLTVEQLDEAMVSTVVPALTGMAKSLFGAGHFVAESDGVFQFALDNVPERLLGRAESAQATVETALSEHLGQPITIVISTGGGPKPPAAGTAAPTASGAASHDGSNSTDAAGGSNSATSAQADTGEAAAPQLDETEDINFDVHELEDATDASTSGVDKLVQAFPGATVVEQEQ